MEELHLIFFIEIDVQSIFAPSTECCTHRLDYEGYKNLVGDRWFRKADFYSGDGYNDHSQADARCRSEDAFLATIDAKEILDYILGSRFYMWTGLKKTATNIRCTNNECSGTEKVTWYNGEAFNFTMSRDFGFDVS